MSWFSNFIAQLLAASTPASAVAPTAGPTAAASAVAAPAAAPGAPGSPERRLQWAPDHSTYVDLNQYPNAIWRDASSGGGSEGAPGSAAGFYTPDSWDGGDVSHGQLISPFSAQRDFSGEAQSSSMPSYQQLRDDGMWDLSDPNSDAWQYLQAYGGGGDPRQDPTALFHGLQNAKVAQGLYGNDDAGRETLERLYRESLKDLDPEFVNLFAPEVGKTMQGYWNSLDSDAITPKTFANDMGDAARGFRDMYLQTPLAAAGGAMIAPGVAGMLGGGVPGTVGAGALIGGGNALAGGGDALRGAVQGGLGAYGGSQIPGAETVAAGATEGATSSVVPQSSTPGFTTIDAEGIPTSSTPAMTNFSANEDTLPILSGQTGSVTPGMLGAFGTLSNSDLDALDAKNRDALEAGDNPAPAAEAPAKSLDTRTLAKVANAIIGMTGGSSPEAQGAPQRQEGQTDSDYSQNLAQYLNLDADSMAQQGLTPGTQEYYDYIMQQADQVIQQIAGDVDVNADDLTAQFRGKSQDELEQLQRALYVRGQMDILTGSGQHTDPFTGASQNVVAPGAGMFNPSVGAFERGKAGDVEALRGMPGQEGFDYLQQLLGRKSDLFGMDRAAKERFEQAKLEDDLRRRRGMLSY